MSLSRQEVIKVVNRYIGVSGGYLGDFTYSSHADFYPEYCDLDIDPYAYPGTTRERFIEILSTQSPHDQAKILRHHDEGPEAASPESSRIGGQRPPRRRHQQSARAMATVLDSLNPLRNNASVAHPNEELLDEPEAHLAINAARTVFAFLDAKLGATS